MTPETAPSCPAAASSAAGTRAHQPTALPGRQQLTAAVRRRDWPHDLSACKWKSLASPFASLLKERAGYADGQGESHAGAIRQPFPDVCMCLSMVWYL